MKGGNITSQLVVIIGVMHKGIRPYGERECEKSFTFGKFTWPVDIQEICPMQHR